jgi:hypothetical protein
VDMAGRRIYSRIGESCVVDAKTFEMDDEQYHVAELLVVSLVLCDKISQGVSVARDLCGWRPQGC